MSACASAEEAYRRVNIAFFLGDHDHFIDPADHFPLLESPSGAIPQNVMHAALNYDMDLDSSRSHERVRARREGRVVEFDDDVRIDQNALARFFDSEFEEDGSRRLYNSGRHPEVQRYVEWFHRGDAGWMRMLGADSALGALSYLYRRELERELDGRTVSNPDFPMYLLDVRQAAIWNEMFRRYQVNPNRSDLRSILEPIYGWPEE
jgi:hypothetical protein